MSQQFKGMAWQHLFAALQSLAGKSKVELGMRTPGDWFVSIRGVELKEGGLLEGLGGDGESPIAATIDASNARPSGVLCSSSMR